MGCRLHVAKTYKVEYGKADFNHLQEQINLLLDDLCENAVWESDAIPDYANEVELNKEELKRGINRLRNEIDDEEFCFYEIDGYSRAEVADILEQFLNEADPDNDFVKLFWF
ncbi:MAG TPA: hypothetical protein DEQ84_00425 [Prevotellaceae bacterium]|nr:hypothetical protein [Prevotellaceae bacterium]